MADNLDPFDVGALESSVNNSAGQVSAVWLGFVAFSAYLAAAVSNISHRQLFLEDTIKLPTINIDLPLVASAVLLPAIFVIYHIYVLLQVVLLARTAAAYNDAVEHAIPDLGDRSRVRQRLANTLFAQMFAGSPREREGLLGMLLRVMAWVTLVIAPPLVLLVFQVKFLPYHSAAVTWIHRGLIVLDILAVLLLWASAIGPHRDITLRSLMRDSKAVLDALWTCARGPRRGAAWRSLVHDWSTALGSVLIVATTIVLSCVVITFPGELNRMWMRHLGSLDSWDAELPQCWTPAFVVSLLPENFDRLSLQGENFIDRDKLTKIETAAKANDQKPYDSERMRSFRGRDLRCSHFEGADLRRVDFIGADLSGASFRGAHLEGAIFSGARLQFAVLDGAQLQGASFGYTILLDGKVDGAQLQGANLRDAQLQGASFDSADLRAANLSGAQLQGAVLDGAGLQGAKLDSAQLQGATLAFTRLYGADLRAARLEAAKLHKTQLQGATLYGAYLQAASLDQTELQGAELPSANLRFAIMNRPMLWRATGHPGCRDTLVRDPRFNAIVEVNYGLRNVKQADATPDAIKDFIEEAVEGVPAGSKAKLRARLATRLVADQNQNAARAEQEAWNTCAKAAKRVDDEADQVLTAQYLIDLGCGTGPGRKYIAEGIYRNWFGTATDNMRLLMARSFLNPPDKPCPGAAALDAKIVSELKEILAPKPPN
jgi:uncharacterized protein YjbI with pentapeptide repeats